MFKLDKITFFPFNKGMQISYIHGRIITVNSQDSVLTGQLCLSAIDSKIDFFVSSGDLPPVGSEVIVKGKFDSKTNTLQVEQGSDFSHLHVEDISWLDAAENPEPETKTTTNEANQEQEKPIDPVALARETTAKLFEIKSVKPSAVPPEMAGMFRPFSATFGARGNMILYPDELDLQIWDILKKENVLEGRDLSNGSEGSFSDLFGPEWNKNTEMTSRAVDQTSMSDRIAAERSVPA